MSQVPHPCGPMQNVLWMITPVGGKSRRAVAVLAACLLASGCGSGPTAVVPTTTLGMFDAYWAAFDQTYPYFAFKGVDWSAQRNTYRDQASRAPSVDSLVQLLRAMVAPLNDGHIGFRNPAGSFVGAWTPRGAPNWDVRRWSAVVSAAGWTQVKVNLGYARFGDIGYVAIGSWNTSQFSEADLDGVLATLRTSRALIIDVRPNGGGNDALAFALAGRFASQTIAAGSVRFRSGAGLGAPTQRSVAPRGPWTWTNPVVLLTGRQCFSSNESFIAAMATLSHVWTLGDTTGGGSGNPETRTLGAGWSYLLPRWIEYAPDGHVIEWNGIAPRVYTPFDTAGRPLAHDPIIAAALQRLGQGA